MCSSASSSKDTTVSGEVGATGTITSDNLKSGKLLFVVSLV